MPSQSERRSVSWAVPVVNWMHKVGVRVAQKNQRGGQSMWRLFMDGAACDPQVAELYCLLMQSLPF